ncbi:type II toxin-antitoxin system VapC family toxin [Nitratireductor luteus]|uniref:type II toxin-antitoxin system VapC family toxin n=1 Tax=Nitratireductor luteus TaxID=2976980 RepID=UPI00223F249F|nr:type II toxin-antitoxin system VapC family toxin [Nitratireductor luteus]
MPAQSSPSCQREREAERVSAALVKSKKRLTSPVAILEAGIGLARPDKFNMPVNAVGPIVLEFLDERGVEIRDLPPAKQAIALSLSAADRYKTGKHKLNLGDCLHYACAKYYRVPILATDDKLRDTDLEALS